MFSFSKITGGIILALSKVIFVIHKPGIPEIIMVTSDVMIALIGDLGQILLDCDDIIPGLG